MSVLKSYFRNLTGQSIRDARKKVAQTRESYGDSLQYLRGKVKRGKGDIAAQDRVLRDYKNLSRDDFATKYRVGRYSGSKFLDRFLGYNNRYVKNEAKKAKKVAIKQRKKDIAKLKEARTDRRVAVGKKVDALKTANRNTALTIGATVAVPTYGAKKYGDMKERRALRRYQEYSSLDDLFEFAQMRLPLYRDTRSIFEKQAARRDKFIDFAKKKGLKGSKAEKEGERLYFAFLKKHGIKHQTGGFGKYVDQWTKGESA